MRSGKSNTRIVTQGQSQRFHVQNSCRIAKEPGKQLLDHIPFDCPQNTALPGNLADDLCPQVVFGQSTLPKGRSICESMTKVGLEHSSSKQRSFADWGQIGYDFKRFFLDCFHTGRAVGVHM